MSISRSTSDRRISCQFCDAVFKVAKNDVEDHDSPEHDEERAPPRRRKSEDRAEDDGWGAEGNRRRSEPRARRSGVGGRRSEARDDIRDDDAGNRSRPHKSATALMVSVLGVVVIAAFAFGAWAFVSRAPRIIPDEQWNAQEVPGRYKARFPGTPTERTDNSGGTPVLLKSFEPDRNAAYITGYTRDSLPPQRLALPREALLTDACNGMMAALGKQGAVELKRSSIDLAGHAGVELIVEIPKERVKAVARCYLANGRLYMIFVGGKRYEPDQENVKRFLNSFAILENAPVMQEAPAQRKPAEPDLESLDEPAPRPIQRPDGPPLVRAAANPLPIDAAPLEGDKTTLALPSPIQDVCIGGGGRFLILHLPQQRQLAIFDANEARIVKYLALEHDNVKFAASMDKLLVVSPEANTIQRWSLTTFEKETTAAWPLKAKPEVALMGSATDGPLICGVIRSLVFIDLQTLQEIPVSDPGHGMFFVGTDSHPLNTRISADGRVVGAWASSGSPTGLDTRVVTGNAVKSYNVHESVGHVVPGPDGETVFTGHGLYTAQATKLGDGKIGAYSLPAVHGDHYLTIRSSNRPVPGRPAPPVGKTELTVHLSGDDRPLVEFKGLEGLDDFDPWNRKTLPFDKTIHLIPLAKLLVLIPKTADKLVLHRFDPLESLEKSGNDYLLVTSRPVNQAVKGQEYRYNLAIASKRGGVKCKLTAAPPNMKITPDGKLTWTPPKIFARDDFTVAVSISDASGQEILHSFKIAIKDRADPAPLPKNPELVAPPRPKPKPLEPRPWVMIGAAPAAPLAGHIRPAPLKTDKDVVTLPGEAADSCVGGGGRYLILHLPEEQKLAIFDANEARIVKQLPAADPNIKFAAGMNKLMLIRPAGGEVERWSLDTFEREAVAPIYLPDAVNSVCMGSASNGPLYVGGLDFVLFLDPATLKPIDVKTPTGRFPGDGVFVRAAANGKAFGMRNEVGGEPHNVTTIVLEGKNSASVNKSREFGGSVVALAPDGRFAYSGAGIHTGQLELIHPKPLPRQLAKTYLPSTHGDYFMRLDYKQWGQFGGKIVFFLAGNHEQPLAQIDNVEGVTNEKTAHGKNPDKLTPDQRLFFIPDAKLVVSIPKSNDRLALHRFDVDEALEKSNIDYLFVASRPPLTATKGAAYVYPLRIKSKKGGIKVRLETGPKGMKIGADGTLTWDVPADVAETEITAILTVADASGQQIAHTVSVDITDRSEAPATKGPERKQPEPTKPEPKKPAFQQ